MKKSAAPPLAFFVTDLARCVIIFAVVSLALAVQARAEIDYEKPPRGTTIVKSGGVAAIGKTVYSRGSACPAFEDIHDAREATHDNEKSGVIAMNTAGNDVEIARRCVSLKGRTPYTVVDRKTVMFDDWESFSCISGQGIASPCMWTYDFYLGAVPFSEE